ncbi:MAG TPA: phosphodiester glycosidase family protein [Armatimonadota bacterium]|jgi:uncharacterized protein YigE (DUF2233 family)
MRGFVAVLVAAVVLPVAGRIAGQAGVHVLPFDTARETLRIHVSPSPAGMAFADVAAAKRPRLAINGTYYGMDGRPLGILRSRGRWSFRGGHMRTAFAVDRRGAASIIRRDDVRRNPANFPFAVAAGPRLLTNGRITLNPEAEGFRAASRRLRASRVALGVRRDGSALAIVDEIPVTLAEFAAVCRNAGAVDAVNLDGGGATALYEDGRVTVSPRIPMANVITIGER